MYESPGASVIGQLPFSPSDLARLEPEKQDRNQLIRSQSALVIGQPDKPPVGIEPTRGVVPLDHIAADAARLSVAQFPA